MSANKNNLENESTTDASKEDKKKTKDNLLEIFCEDDQGTDFDNSRGRTSLSRSLSENYVDQNATNAVTLVEIPLNFNGSNE